VSPTVWQEPSVEDFWEVLLVARKASPIVLSDFLHVVAVSALHSFVITGGVAVVLVHP